MEIGTFEEVAEYIKTFISFTYPYSASIWTEDRASELRASTLKGSKYAHRNICEINDLHAPLFVDTEPESLP